MDRNFSKILEIERRAFLFFSGSWLAASFCVLIFASLNLSAAKILGWFLMPIFAIRFITLGIVYSVVGSFAIYKEALFFKFDVPFLKLGIQADAVIIVISGIGWLFVAFTL